MIIYRIIQEALNNIINHAKGSQIDIPLNYLPDSFHLTIKDNGIRFEKERPFSQDKSGSGSGIYNMQNRARLWRRFFIRKQTRYGHSLKVDITFEFDGMSGKKINVCLVDDHKLLRKGMVELIDGFNGYQVIGECNNGKEFMSLLKSIESPDIVLLDINMPEMDGHETAIWLNNEHPRIKVIALSMYDDEKSIIRMIKSGARGYVLKDAEPAELRKAFDDVVSKGYYYSDLVSGVLVHSLHSDDPANQKKVSINDRETEFLKLACTELTYKEIANRMCLAPRTIDGYREALFEKLNVKSRVGLVVYAIRNGFVKIN